MCLLLFYPKKLSKSVEGSKNDRFLKKIVNLFKKIQKTSCKIEKNIV